MHDMGLFYFIYVILDLSLSFTTLTMTIDVKWGILWPIVESGPADLEIGPAPLVVAALAALAALAAIVAIAAMAAQLVLVSA